MGKECQNKESQYLEKLSSRSVTFQNPISDWSKMEAIFSKIDKKGKNGYLGCRGQRCQLLNMLNLKNDIQYAVDINPRKKGHFYPAQVKRSSYRKI